jgi:hypothetical protein
MAGYLDQYGAGEEQRSKIVKLTIASLVGILALGGVLFWYFQNYPQEREVRQFFARLAAHDYRDAYKLWGCATPCRDYPEPEFMSDWGPQAVPNPAAFHVLSAESCGSGVLIKAGPSQSQAKMLWVEHGADSLGFAPPGMEICPNRGPFKIMLVRLRNKLR